MNRSMKKERLRGEFLEARRKMAFEEVFRLSSLVQKRFLGSDFFRPSRRLALYSSFQNEVLTDEIFQTAIGLGKEVFYPRVVRGAGRLAFFRVNRLSDLSPGSYEVPEPGEGAEAKVGPDSFDLVVVPGVAFDLKGSRIGYGKGYYDKFLKNVRSVIVALAYGFQVLSEDIPAEPHDMQVSAIVTERRTLRIQGRGD